MDSQTQNAIQNLLNNTDFQKVGVHGGTQYLGVAAYTGLSATTIQPREDTVITVCTGHNAAGVAFNFLTGTGSFNISGITLLVSDLFVAPSGYRITAITITSGSALIHS